MLTIGELASYAGVTVRAVRHYHAKGLLPEPERDHFGYRRYDGGAVVELIRIRTLAEAGVPLARVRELLQAGEDEFAAAIADIDRRLRAEIRQRQRHRERIARLASGDSLVLPPEVVEYLDRLRALGVDERIVQAERDGWIPLAAHSPERVPEWMARKRSSSPTRGSSTSTAPSARLSTAPTTTRGWSGWPTSWPPTSRGWRRSGVRTMSTTPISTRRSPS
ncbi:MerR family transcriptional regulator [Nonomuraea thailandensis]